MLARFQAQLEQYPAPWISQKQRLLQDRNQPRLLAQLNPCRSPRRSMSASTTRPIRHSAPSSLSVVTRSHEADLIHSWRADSLAFVWLDPGITPCCKSRKLQGHEFFAKTRNGKQSPIRIPSIALSKSPVSLTRDDEAPHIFIRKTRLQPADFLNISEKRLLQHGVIPGSSQTKARESALQEWMRSTSWDLVTTESDDGALCRIGRVVEADIDLRGERHGFSCARRRG